MPELCATLDGESVCMPLDLTVFDDPRQGDVPEGPGDPPGAIEATGAPAIRTRVAPGAIPDAWPRDERIAGELVKGQERIECEVMVRTSGGGGAGTGTGRESNATEVILMGEEVFRAVMGRSP